MSGPAKRPLALVRLEGNPGKRILPSESEEVAAPREVPDCPRWLDAEARKEWARVTPLLQAMGVLGKVDRSALAGYCMAYSRWQKAERVITKKGLTMRMRTKGGGVYVMQRPEVAIALKYLDKVKSLSAEFGMTASSRARLSIGGGKKKDDFEDC